MNFGTVNNWMEVSKNECLPFKIGPLQHRLAQLAESENKLTNRVTKHPETYFGAPVRALVPVGANSLSTAANVQAPSSDLEGLIALEYTIPKSAK